MAYNSNIPLPTDLISQSQPQLLANFQAINTLLDVNHYTFNSAGATDGKHKYVSMPEQLADPATAVNELAIYSKEGAISTVAELFLRRENNGTAYAFTESGQNVIGWTRLPSGILIKWGNDNAGDGSTTQNFPLVDGGGVAQPAFTATPYIILFIKTENQVANNTAVANWNLSSTNSATQYTINLRNTTGAVIAGNIDYRWIALGI